MKEDPPPALRIWKVGEIRQRPIFRITRNHYWGAFNWLEEQGIDSDWTYFNEDPDFKKYANDPLERGEFFFVDEETWPMFLADQENKRHDDMVVYDKPQHFYGEIREEDREFAKLDEEEEYENDEDDDYEEEQATEPVRTVFRSEQIISRSVGTVQTITNPLAKKKESNMKNNTLNMIGNAGKNAAKRAAAAQANEILLQGGKAILAKLLGIPMEMLDGEGADKVARLLIPIAVHIGADQYSKFVRDAGIAPDTLKAGAALATEKAAEDVIEPIMAMAIPMLKEVAKLGKAAMANMADSAESAGALSASEERNIVDEVERVSERDKVTVPTQG